MSGRDAVGKRIDEAGGSVDDDGTVVVVRTVAAEGRSRAHLGGRSVPQGVLAEIADDLVTVHGQADQLRLRTPSHQRAALDAFAGREHAELLDEYRTAWTERSGLLEEITDLTTRAQERAGRPSCCASASPRSSAWTRSSARTPSSRRSSLASVTHRSSVSVRRPRTTRSSGTTHWKGTTDRGRDLRRRAGTPRARDREPPRPEPGRARRADRGDRVRPHGRRHRDLGLRRGPPGGPGRAGAGAHAPGGAEQPHPDVRGHDRRRPRLGERRWTAPAGPRRRRRAPALDDGARRGAHGAPVRAREPDHGFARRVRGASGRCGDRRARGPRHGGFASRGRRDPADVPGPWGADVVTLSLVPHPGSPPRPLGKGASGGELSRVMLAIEVALATSGADAGTDDAVPLPTFVFDEVDAGSADAPRSRSVAASRRSRAPPR
ncbi:hypothetical protein NKG05_30220 [Oerskovia sp. M15]